MGRNWIEEHEGGDDKSSGKKGKKGGKGKNNNKKGNKGNNAQSPRSNTDDDEDNDDHTNLPLAKGDDGFRRISQRYRTHFTFPMAITR